MTRASLAKDPKDVAAMFDDVAGRYDRTNDILSVGHDRYWRREVVRTVAARKDQNVLDLAAGTGTSSWPMTRSGANVVSSDFSLGMLAEGRRRFPELAFVAGDALHLPFADQSFDAVTISFGLRNVADVGQALAEMRRITRPGGRLVIAEFSHPVWTPMRIAYEKYLIRALPPIARRVSSDPAAYVYLAESIQAWPTARELADQILGAGWADVAWRNLTGGIVALHRATNAGSGSTDSDSPPSTPISTPADQGRAPEGLGA